MIKQLTLVGFKSFLERTLVLGDLTVLTGLNSSGKSSIIQALRILEKAARKEDTILLDGHGTSDEIRNSFHNKEIQLSVLDAQSREFGLTFGGEAKYSTYQHENFGFPELIYVSANRFGPKNSVPIYNDSFKRNRLGPNGENLFQFIRHYEGQTINPLLIHPNSEGETVEYNIRGWLSVISPNVKFRYEIDKFSDTSYGVFNEHRSTNVGFGLSYSLSVIAVLVIATLIPNSIVIIENPEAHLHPRGQSEMAKLIALCAQTGVQIIIETHSDHVFDGIRLAAKNNSGFSEKVQIHWFELNENQNTEVASPDIDSDGRLSFWPKGLFDEFEKNATSLL